MLITSSIKEHQLNTNQLRHQLGMNQSTCVPTKVSFFAWEASWGKVLTQDQLKRRGWILANRCFLCCDDEETINHVLIHCPKARVLWNLMFSLFGVNWVLPLTIRDTLLGWSASFVDKKRGKTWQPVPLYLFWTVWKERNRIVFYNEALSFQRLKSSFVCNLFSWSKSCLDGEPHSLINFVDWLGSNWGLVSVCFFVFLLRGFSCILPVCFGLPSCSLLLINFLCFIYKKKSCICQLNNSLQTIWVHTGFSWLLGFFFH